MAIVVAPLTTVVMNGVSDEQSGAASGVNNAASRLSGLFAVAIVGSVAAIVFAANAGMAGETVPRFGSLPELTSPVRAALESAFIEAYSIGMLIAAVCGALAGATAYLTLDHTNAETCNPLRP
jgi:hypothetical protein